MDKLVKQEIDELNAILEASGFPERQRASAKKTIDDLAGKAKLTMEELLKKTSSEYFLKFGTYMPYVLFLGAAESIVRMKQAMETGKPFDPEAHWSKDLKDRIKKGEILL